MAIYLQYEGIEGTVSSKGHEGWIQLDSMQFGCGRAISTSIGGTADREATKPSISEISVTKLLDKSSPLLFNEATVGKAKKATIHLCKTGTSEIETYMSYELDDCMISGYSMSTGGDRPNESLSLNFAKIVTKYTPFNEKGDAGSPIPAGYNLIEGTKI
ncbi:MAG: type VI secretion system tube protein Hcp [Gammaproteobacteria bacterium]|nr:type VI secretion system tube protein Hcp [Gammaproteobacteria bacterium]